MSIAGVAWASVVAQYLGLALSVVMLRHYLRRLGGAFQLPLIIDRRKIIAMTRINADIFIRTLCLLTGTALFMNISAAQGTVILAANAALLNLQTLAAYGLDGFAHAAEVLVGRAIGAKAPQQLRQAVHRSSMMAAVLALLIGLIFYLFGAWIITLLTDIDAVRETAMRFLPWAALAPVISFAAFQLDGIFIGATRSAEMRNAMLVSVGFFWLVLQVSVPLAANHGLWFALVLFLGARSLALLWYYGRVREMADPGA
jgi:MATE family multidrug resistance protein